MTIRSCRYPVVLSAFFRLYGLFTEKFRCSVIKGLPYLKAYIASSALPLAAQIYCHGGLFAAYQGEYGVSKYEDGNRPFKNRVI